MFVKRTHFINIHIYRESPGEIKRREVSWTLMKKLDTFYGSRREQEEGGGAGPSS